MSVTILAPRKWTPAERLQAMESPGRKVGKPAGSHMDDLSALRKCIVLCPLCVSKFSAKTSRYKMETEIPWATGRCDGCRVQDQRCRMFVAEEAYAQVRMTKEETRTMARRGYQFIG